MVPMNVPLLKRLSEAHGIPGQEDAIRAIVRDELSELCEFSTDAMGNLHCVKKATHPPKDTEAKKLMIAAHMDEIGFVARFIDDKGFIRIHTLGGFDTRQMPSQRVIVYGREGALPGVLMLGTKPKHMLSPDEMNKAASVNDFFVDIGLPADQVKAKVRIGDMITMDREFRPMGNLFTGKAMDDRVAVYVMIEALRAVKKHSIDIHAVATTQEEIGLRGATASGSAIQPDICVAIDVTLSNDIPGVPEQDSVTRLGEGTAIKILDSSLICHPKVVEHFRSLAEQKGIKHQMELLTAGGTDAGGVQRQNGGVPSFTLSVPCRYIHTVNESVHGEDVDASVALLAAYIEDAHNGNYAFD